MAIRLNETDEPEETYGCDNPKFNTYDVMSFMILPAICLMIFFAFYVKRRNRLPNTCGGRPGTVYAVNLLDSYQTRVAHACAIGVSCVAILDLFFGNYYVVVDYSSIPDMAVGVVSTLILVANIWMVALAYFPISLCLTTKKKIMGNGFGFAYTFVWTAFYAQKIMECPRAEGRIGELNFLLIVPIFILYTGLLVQFALGFHREMKARRSKKKNVLQEDPSQYESFTKSHYCQRVQYLLTPKRVLEKRVELKPSDAKKFCEKMKIRFQKIYKNEVGFKYSKRMVVTAILSALSLYELGIAYIGGVGLFLDLSRQLVDESGTLYEFFDFANSTETFYETQAFLYIVIDSFWPTCVAAMGIAVFFSFHFLYTYRKNTLDLWRGDKSLLPKQELQNSYLVASSLRYSGYHVGFALWGFLILQFLFWLITVVCWYFIVRAFRVGQSNWLLELCRNQWLTGVFVMVIYYIQVFLARFFYLEGKGEVLSITNRRSLHNATYFFMFLNIVLGLLSCLLRIGYSILFGILMVGRIDLCLLMKGFEFWDSGFKSYLAFLQLEVAHTHPVVVSFCYLLWGMKGKRARLNSVDAYDESFHKKHTKRLKSLEQGAYPGNYGACRSSRVARNRWHVAYTMLQNPSLVADRSPEALWKLIHGSSVASPNDAHSAASPDDAQSAAGDIESGGEKLKVFFDEEPGEKTRTSSMDDQGDASSQCEELKKTDDPTDEAVELSEVGSETLEDDGAEEKPPIEDDATVISLETIQASEL